MARYRVGNAYLSEEEYAQHTRRFWGTIRFLVVLFGAMFILRRVGPAWLRELGSALDFIAFAAAVLAAFMRGALALFVTIIVALCALCTWSMEREALSLSPATRLPSAPVIPAHADDSKRGASAAKTSVSRKASPTRAPVGPAVARKPPAAPLGQPAGQGASSPAPLTSYTTPEGRVIIVAPPPR